MNQFHYIIFLTFFLALSFDSLPMQQPQVVLNDSANQVVVIAKQTGIASKRTKGQRRKFRKQMSKKNRDADKSESTSASTSPIQSRIDLESKKSHSAPTTPVKKNNKPDSDISNEQVKKSIILNLSELQSESNDSISLKPNGSTGNSSVPTINSVMANSGAFDDNSDASEDEGEDPLTVIINKLSDSDEDVSNSFDDENGPGCISPRSNDEEIKGENDETQAGNIPSSSTTSVAPKSKQIGLANQDSDMYDIMDGADNATQAASDDELEDELSSSGSDNEDTPAHSTTVSTNASRLTNSANSTVKLASKLTQYIISNVDGNEDQDGEKENDNSRLADSASNPDEDNAAEGQTDSSGTIVISSTHVANANDGHTYSSSGNEKEDNINPEDDGVGKSNHSQASSSSLRPLPNSTPLAPIPTTVTGPTPISDSNSENIIRKKNRRNKIRNSILAITGIGFIGACVYKLLSKVPKHRSEKAGNEFDEKY